jgi:ribosome-binding protein aMBF1 (putative translation factor)
MKQFNNAGFKNFQDFEPVVLSKTKSTNSYSTQKSNTNVHIDNKNNLDNDDIVPIAKYTQEQIDIIRTARTALNLTQEQLTKKINSSLPKNFINEIESGKTAFNNKTYNTILRNLGVNLKK